MTSSTSPRNRVVRLSLTQRGQQVLSRAKAETGITQLAMTERLLEWFAAQDPRVRTMILSPYPEVRRGLAKLVLEEMQANPHKDWDAAPQFDALVDHDFGPAPDEHRGTARSRARKPRPSHP
jgi:hypothetical protein